MPRFRLIGGPLDRQLLEIKPLREGKLPSHLRLKHTDSVERFAYLEGKTDHPPEPKDATYTLRQISGDFRWFDCYVHEDVDGDRMIEILLAR